MKYTAIEDYLLEVQFLCKRLFSKTLVVEFRKPELFASFFQVCNIINGRVDISSVKLQSLVDLW